MQNSSDSVAYYLHIFNEVLLPSICVAGLLGNLMALLLIQTNRSLKKMRSNVFLSALAMCSTVFLTMLFLLWLEPYTNWEMAISSPIGCKVMTFCAHWSDFCTAWLITIVALDRTLILVQPAKRARFYQCCSAERMTVVLIIVIIFGHSWLIPITTTVVTEMGMECMSDPKYYTVYHWFTILETVFGMCVPLVFIIVSNCITAWKLHVYQGQNDTEGSSPGPSKTTHTSGGDTLPQHKLVNRIKALRSAESPLPCSSRCRTPLHSKGGSARPPSASATSRTASTYSRRSLKRIQTKDLNLAKTLLLVTSVFALLNIPTYMCRLFLPAFPQVMWQVYVWFFSYRLYYCHHALLFYLYIFNSRQMRKQLRPTAMKLLECYCIKTVSDFGH